MLAIIKELSLFKLESKIGGCGQGNCVQMKLAQWGPPATSLRRQHSHETSSSHSPASSRTPLSVEMSRGGIDAVRFKTLASTGPISTDVNCAELINHVADQYHRTDCCILELNSVGSINSVDYMAAHGS